MRNIIPTGIDKNTIPIINIYTTINMTFEPAVPDAEELNIILNILFFSPFYLDYRMIFIIYQVHSEVMYVNKEICRGVRCHICLNDSACCAGEYQPLIDESLCNSCLNAPVCYDLYKSVSDCTFYKIDDVVDVP